METLTVGSSYHSQKDKREFYNFDVTLENLVKVTPDTSGKVAKIALAIVPKTEEELAGAKDKAPRLKVVVIGAGGVDLATLKNEKGAISTDAMALHMNIDYEKLMALPLDRYGKVELLASKGDTMNDLSNYSVSAKNDDGTYENLGRGYDVSSNFGEFETLGTAHKKIIVFDDPNNPEQKAWEKETSKLYRVFLNAEKANKMPTERVTFESDGSPKTYPRLTVSVVPVVSKYEKNEESGEYKKVIDHKLVNIPNNSEAVLHLDMDKVKQLKPFLAGSEDNEEAKVPVYKLVAMDKNPDSIRSDKKDADLMVMENKFAPGMDDALVAEAKENKNYLGSGYTQNPYMLKLSENELNPEGLQTAIMKNDTVRSIAIMHKAPFSVDKENLELIKTKVSDNLSKRVLNFAEKTLEKQDDIIAKSQRNKLDKKLEEAKEAKQSNQKEEVKKDVKNTKPHKRSVK